MTPRNATALSRCQAAYDRMEPPDYWEDGEYVGEEPDPDDDDPED